ncbi:uncharacterized protein LOC130015207 [Mercurialis annua]|uniref:uncharacterized protein LOC130015207 n=1 Tax=Mercurialis annua TaxID=3986 RepID=UPI0024ADCE03|nr:uncharacterized protein LOC130015207 [Mercurialis annua]
MEKKSSCIFVLFFFILLLQLQSDDGVFTKSKVIILDELDIVMAPCFVAYSSLPLQHSLDNSFSAINVSSGENIFFSTSGKLSSELQQSSLVFTDPTRARFRAINR